MNNLIPFNYNSKQVRTEIKNSDPWFVARDIADVLGISDTRTITDRLDSDEWDKTTVTDSLGREQEAYIISESGLYEAISRSNKSEAKAFQRWVRKEVLPSIRKHGMYAKDELLDNPDLMIEVLQELKKEREEKKLLTVEIAQQKQIIGELKPRADYTDTILKNKGLVTITQIAKDYGMSGQEMNTLLHENGVQYKQSEQWLLYTKYQDKGYTHSETINIVRKDGRPDITMNTKWTQKGRLFIYGLLKKSGILPVIEREDQAS